MVCIYCGHKTSVINSRKSGKTNTTWRRRRCLSCKAIATSRENYDLDSSLRVRSNSGRLEPFSRDKMFLSIYKSLSHRKTSLEDAGALGDTVIGHLFNLQTNGVITRQALAELTQSVLARFDKAAATYYAAHHPGCRQH